MVAGSLARQWLGWRLRSWAWCDRSVVDIWQVHSQYTNVRSFVISTQKTFTSCWRKKRLRFLVERMCFCDHVGMLYQTAKKLFHVNLVLVKTRVVKSNGHYTPSTLRHIISANCKVLPSSFFKMYLWWKHVQSLQCECDCVVQRDRKKVCLLLFANLCGENSHFLWLIRTFEYSVIYFFILGQEPRSEGLKAARLSLLISLRRKTSTRRWGRLNIKLKSVFVVCLPKEHISVFCVLCLPSRNMANCHRRERLSLIGGEVTSWITVESMHLDDVDPTP